MVVRQKSTDRGRRIQQNMFAHNLVARGLVVRGLVVRMYGIALKLTVRDKFFIRLQLTTEPEQVKSFMSVDFSLSSFPELETERLFLRKAISGDARAILAVFADPAVTHFHNLSTFTCIEEALAFIDRQAKRFESGQGIRWGIAQKKDNILIGSCGFSWNQQGHSAEIGYELASAFWKQHIMTEALRAILQFGFDTVGLQSVVAEIVLDNIASKNLLKKLGFQSQGALKQHRFWKGQHHDLEQFVLTKTETNPV
jgi:[ribosomal protein S5]-alanine N-acetyltransferase